MSRMALLMSTDDWSKVEIYRSFLNHHRPAVWRTRGRYSQRWLSQFAYPIDLYFYHLNVIRFQAQVNIIKRAEGWSLEDIPREFHSDKTSYSLFIFISQIKPINPLSIENFPKWDNPSESYHRGQLGILRVQNINQQ